MNPTHICMDRMCSCLSNSREERARLYPTEPAMSDRMVENHFEAQATEAVFRAMFDQFVAREVRCA